MLLLVFYSRYKSSLFALLEMKEVLMDVFSRCLVSRMKTKKENRISMVFDTGSGRFVGKVSEICS